jgi:hypothetical protein
VIDVPLLSPSASWLEAGAYEAPAEETSATVNVTLPDGRFCVRTNTVQDPVVSVVQVAVPE